MCLMSTAKRTKKGAPRTKLAPGEHSIDRVSVQTKGGVKVIRWQGRLPDGKLIPRQKTEMTTRSERALRDKAKARWAALVQSQHSTVEITMAMTRYIDDVVSPALEKALASEQIKPKTYKRHALSLKHLRSAFDGYSIGDAVRFRTMERALINIAYAHGEESARQCRGVLSKYILGSLRRDELIQGNPLAGMSIDLPKVKKTTKGSSRDVTLTRDEYDRVVEHLLERDTTVPLPPGTDRRGSSIRLHQNIVRAALIQAGIGLRIGEVVELHFGDMAVDADNHMLAPVSPEKSKTHRGRNVPLVNPRIEEYIAKLARSSNPGDLIVGAPADPTKVWDSNAASKAATKLFKDMAKVLNMPKLAQMTSHSWRATLNTLTAGTIPLEVRAAYFGHSQEVNVRHYTDMTAVDLMRGALQSQTDADDAAEPDGETQAPQPRLTVVTEEEPSANDPDIAV